MSCIIKIKIANQEIILKQNSNISPDSVDNLLKTLDVFDMRKLYSNIKDLVNIDSIVKGEDSQSIKRGEDIYLNLVKEAKIKNEYLTPLNLLMTYKGDTQSTLDVKNYVNSLDGTKVLDDGNFVTDMTQAYKQSPQTLTHINNVFFAADSTKRDLFTYLTKLPGMETVKISVAFVNTDEKQPRIKGSYIGPDNIIQIIVPNISSFVIGVSSGKDDFSNKRLQPKALSAGRSIILHELGHSVFTEFYKSNSKFRGEMKDLHTKFIEAVVNNSASKFNIDAKQFNNLAKKYEDLQEFISDIFINRNIVNILSKIESNPNDKESNATLYTYFKKILGDTISVPDSLLDDMIKSYSSEDLIGSVNATAKEEQEDFLENDEFRNIFYNGGIDEEVEKSATAPRTQYDSFSNTNVRALYIQQFFIDNYKEGKFSKDAYYKAMEKPNEAKLGQLHEKDLVLIPWVRYIKKTATEAGRWQEQGVIVDDKGEPIFKNKKLIIVDVTRNDEGEIEQNSDLGIIQERTKLAPVVYSNHKRSHVVVAKVGKDLTKDTINTISFPYDMIKGIRKQDLTYFDYTFDYQEQLDKQLKIKSELESKIENNPDEYLSNELSQIERNIEWTTKNLARAEEYINENKLTYSKYAFSIVDPEDENARLMNVSESEYVSAGYNSDKKRSFVEDDDAVYRIIKTKNGKHMTVPNYKLFQVMYSTDEAMGFVKGMRNSEDYQTAVTKGDLVRYKIYNKDLKTEVYEWGPVFRSLTNGIEVATKNGKGLTIPFNKVVGYAKNTHSDWFKEKIGVALMNQVQAVKDLVYAEKGSDERSTAMEMLTYRSLKFNSDYNQKDGEEEEDAIVRFDKNFNSQINRVTPYKTYVKILRKYSQYDATEKKTKDYEYDSVELILAKTDEGFLTVRYAKSTGKPTIELVPFKGADDTEMLFLIDDLTEVKEVWEEHIKERDTTANNYKENTGKERSSLKEYTLNIGTPEEAKYIERKDSRIDPKSFADIYDFYDDVNKNAPLLLKGDVIKLPNTAKDATTPYYFRKVISVRNDGAVIVAENRKEDVKLKNGFVMKKGFYARAIKPENILAVGLKTHNLEKEIYTDNHKNEQVAYAIKARQDIIERRIKAFEYAKRDLDWNDFRFRTKEQALAWNKNVNRHTESGWYKEYTPLTTKLLDKSISENDSEFLNKDLKPISSDTVWVEAWVFDGLHRPIRGINANTTFWKAQYILDTKGRFPKLKEGLIDQLMIGDWIITKYKDKNGESKEWASMIERFDGDRIYTLNVDNSTYAVNLKNIVGIKTSIRNDKHSNFTRGDKIKDLLGLRKNNSGYIKETPVQQTKNSLDTNYKSPKDSTRALFEIGNRFNKLNPDVVINYVNDVELNEIRKTTGFNYTDTRAFIMNGEVNINMDKASISDVIHEYAHLFLHSLKYDNYDLYQNLISVTNNNPIFEKVRKTYLHLENEDLQEEVFVTVLGEYLRNEIKDEKLVNDSKESIDNFSNYIAEKAKMLFNMEGTEKKLDPTEVMYMKLEDVITLVGDWVMNNRLTDLDVEIPFSNEHSKNILKLKNDLIKSGLLVQECYG